MKINEDIIFYAFRYCLGRKTYAVAVMVEFLINNWNKLNQQTQIQIRKEIKEAIKRNKAGMECDINEWNKILKLKVK